MVGSAVFTTYANVVLYTLVFYANNTAGSLLLFYALTARSYILVLLLTPPLVRFPPVPYPLDCCRPCCRDPLLIIPRTRTRCEESTCIKQASFAMDGDRYPMFCNDHRQAKMINTRNQRCRAAGCSRGASFAATGGERGQFCSEHKGKNMVNTRRR